MQEIMAPPIGYMSRLVSRKPGPATLPTKVELVAWGSRALRARPEASGLRAQQGSALDRAAVAFGVRQGECYSSHSSCHKNCSACRALRGRRPPRAAQPLDAKRLSEA